MEKPNFNPLMANLAELIPLLDYPTFLAEKIRQLKMEGNIGADDIKTLRFYNCLWFKHINYRL